MRALGIDYGRKNIGVALATTSLAEPLIILDNDDHLIFELKKICQTEAIEVLVVGLSEGNMATETKAFAENLKSQLKLPLVFSDETLTSREASLRLRHAKHSVRSEPQDAFQAAIILQNYLDSFNKNL